MSALTEFDKDPAITVDKLTRSDKRDFTMSEELDEDPAIIDQFTSNINIHACLGLVSVATTVGPVNNIP